jgi:hypothetical protein
LQRPKQNVERQLTIRQFTSRQVERAKSGTSIDVPLLPFNLLRQCHARTPLSGIQFDYGHSLLIRVLDSR